MKLTKKIYTLKQINQHVHLFQSSTQVMLCSNRESESFYIQMCLYFSEMWVGEHYFQISNNEIMIHTGLRHLMLFFQASNRCC